MSLPQYGFNSYEFFEYMVELLELECMTLDDMRESIRHFIDYTNLFGEDEEAEEAVENEEQHENEEEINAERITPINLDY